MSLTPDNAMSMNDAELRMRAIATLKQELGVAGTLRFPALIHPSPTDSVEISHPRNGTQEAGLVPIYYGEQTFLFSCELSQRPCLPVPNRPNCVPTRSN